ncbi:KPN_02809 family neutral zinc metallopeptidase [Pengzhenrongella frigida]|uniref:Neutral zinc metallopeptidase n=1 Tax=Pengzhenrongella frigida TaxID=1259133 RepID=A0A4Q5MXY8_9MICO|nr:neutral zinc metallopeptidase [Cellulomonas sp. HLT2-17]RYV50548.1 neutral zinc metallopeptidase [Cellulomonas sp. HLT2-17]
MTFQDGGSFEGGRVRTRRGGRGVAIGGGLGGLIVLIGALFFNVDLSPIADGLGGDTGGEQTEEYVAECSAEQANAARDCRLSATARALDTYWSDALAPLGVAYTQPGVVSFEQATDTACGSATSATGPFYCPPDQTVYVDLGFFDDLRTRFGASGGPLAEEYVIAHEFGHHIEQLTGLLTAADRSGTGPTSDSVRIELTADCFAGMWTGHAATTVDPATGVPFLAPITAAELADALSAASAVGDDRIQESATGTVDPESWTHGSSEQRQRWFSAGYDGASVQECNALEAATL